MGLGFELKVWVRVRVRVRVRGRGRGRGRSRVKGKYLIHPVSQWVIFCDSQKKVLRCVYVCACV